MALVSIIVPIYNIQGYLGQCIDSLLMQTFTDIEVILVDDGSSDRSAEICDDYAIKDSRIIVIHKANGGLPSARNAGMDIATGEWLIHVDGDDWIEPETVERFVAAVDSPLVDVVVGGLHFAYDDCLAMDKDYLPEEWQSDKVEYMQRFMQQDWTCLCGTMTRRSLYEEYSLKSPIGITWQEDFYLIIRLLYFAREIRVVQRAFYNYRQRSDSIMNSWSDRTIESGKRVVESTMQFFEEHDHSVFFEKFLSWRWFNIMQNKISDHRYYVDIQQMTSKYRHYILTCPYLSVKRKAVYLLHSFGVLGFFHIYRK